MKYQTLFVSTFSLGKFIKLLSNPNLQQIHYQQFLHPIVLKLRSKIFPRFNHTPNTQSLRTSRFQTNFSPSQSFLSSKSSLSLFNPFDPRTSSPRSSCPSVIFILFDERSCFCSGRGWKGVVRIP